MLYYIYPFVGTMESDRLIGVGRSGSAFYCLDMDLLYHFYSASAIFPTFSSELNSKSFSRIAKNAEITINIPKSKAFFVIAGRSVNNAGKNIYAGSSNASGIYSFYKIAGLDEQITESNDKEAITFTSNTWMEVIYVFV